MNSCSIAKYKQVPDDVEKSALASGASTERFYFIRLEKIRREKDMPERFDIKTYQRKKLKLGSPLEVGEESSCTPVDSRRKTRPENFTRVVLITSLTFTSKRHF